MAFEDDGTPDVLDCLLYVDGRLEPVGGSAPEPISTSAAGTVRIGLGPWAAARSFEGLIDDLRIYDRALSPEEIAGAAGRTAPFDR